MTTTVITTARQLTALSREEADRLRLYRNAIATSPSGSLTIRADCMPSPGERDKLSARLAEIDEHLRPDAGALRRLVTSIFLWFTPTAAAAGTLEAAVEAYSAALKGLPLWAIVEAAKTIRASGATFRPSAPELYALARSKCAGLTDEHAAIVAALTATPVEPIPETERARVLAGFRALIAELGATNFIKTGAAR
jgi:hypothetical protein